MTAYLAITRRPRQARKKLLILPHRHLLSQLAAAYRSPQAGVSDVIVSPMQGFEWKSEVIASRKPEKTLAELVFAAIKG